jgi:23S rRNA (pseudouridine1915-N3)-methyltransferase
MDAIQRARMRARLIAVGDRMPAWVGEGFAEYAKRLSRELPLELVEISTRQRARETQRAIADEGAAMLAAIPKSAHVVALDGRGKTWSSEDLAQQLAQWRMQGQDLAFLIGGPDGLAPAALERAQQRWSLGPLTLPHPLVRIVLAEQLYRAVSLLGNHPYHRA